MTESVDALPLVEIAGRLHYAGPKPERYVKRLLRRHGTPYVKRGGVWLMTEAHYRALLAAMETRHAPAFERARVGVDVSAVKAVVRTGTTTKEALRLEVRRRLEAHRVPRKR